MTRKQREADVLSQLAHAKMMVQTAKGLNDGPDSGYYRDYLWNAEATLLRCIDNIHTLQKGAK